jgi:hypothetical protein
MVARLRANHAVSGNTRAIVLFQHVDAAKGVGYNNSADTSAGP